MPQPGDGEWHRRPADKSFNKFTPTYTIDYAFTDDINGYAKLANGYRRVASIRAHGCWLYQWFQPGERALDELA